MGKISNKIIVTKVLIWEMIILMLSVYSLQCDLDDTQNDRFYNNFIYFAKKLR